MLDVLFISLRAALGSSRSALALSTYEDEPTGMGEAYFLARLDEARGRLLDAVSLGVLEQAPALPLECVNEFRRHVMELTETTLWIGTLRGEPSLEGSSLAGALREAIEFALTASELIEASRGADLGDRR